MASSRMPRPSEAPCRFKLTRDPIREVAVAPKASNTPLPEPELGGREFARYRVNAHALWKAEGVEIRWPVWTLSWGGAALAVGSLRAPAGLRRTVQFVQSQGSLGTAEVEIVHTTDGTIGLRFLEIDQQLRESLEVLFADATPIP